MYITTAVIKQLASSPPEYCAGYRDYNSRGIYSYRRGTNQEGQTVLSSNVLDSEQQSYSVTIALSGDGRPIWYQCGCSKAVNGAGLCRHGVALLFRYIDDQKASSVRPAPCSPEKPITSPLCTWKEMSLSTTFSWYSG